MYFTDYNAYYFPTEQEFQVAGIFFDYVIAGASRSGLSCAETIRANDDSGSILVVSKEKVLPYKRTKLSKRLFQGYSEEDFLLYPRSWYTDQRISLYLGTGAVDLVPEINTLFLDDGRKIGYGKLCIATGGSPLTVRVPGNPPVYYLREKEDGRELYKHASGWKRVCVIGNGIQGIELSEQFVKMGKQVDIAGRTPRAMQRKVDPAMSRLITETLTSNNVGITSYKDLEDKQISSRYDGIAASVGIFPETAWLESSGLNLCPGVVIDKGCRTSHQDIYAAGDVTEPLLPFILGMWHGAEYQGQCAGRGNDRGRCEYEASAF